MMHLFSYEVAHQITPHLLLLLLPIFCISELIVGHQSKTLASPGLAEQQRLRAVDSVKSPTAALQARWPRICNLGA